MNVSLTPDWERFVREQVDTGRFQTESDVVREGLRLLHEHQQTVEEIDQKIERGLADVAAGRTYSPDTVRATLRARRASRVDQTS